MPYVKGPTKVSMMPDPFVDKVTITYSGVDWQSVYSPYLMYKWRTSTDGKNWGSFGNGTTIDNCGGSGSFTIDFSSVTMGHYVQVRVIALSFGYGSNGKQYSGDEHLLVARRVQPTACKPPASITLSKSVSEGEVTLSWSGAEAGANNPISGYEIQYCDSADLKSWGARYALQTVDSTARSGSIKVKPPDTRGHYRGFLIRTLTKDTQYISEWNSSDDILQRNTLPVAPTKFTAEPAAYTTEDITLKWSGATAGTSPIKQYIIQKAESADNKTWGNWQTIIMEESTETSGSVVVSPTRTLDVYTLYRICVQDKLDCLSAYKQSNSVYSLARPFAPVLTAPKAASTTYSRNPKALIQTEAPPGAKPQTVFVKGTDGETYNSVDHPEMFTVSGTATTAIKTIFTNPDTALGSFSASAHCKTVDVGPAVTRGFTVAGSPFTGEIEAGAPVKAAHITELRTAVNTVRNYYSLPAYPWALSVLAGRTNISYWPYHVLELRAAVEGVLDLLAEYGGGQKVDWLDIGRGRPRASVMLQLQDVITGL